MIQPSPLLAAILLVLLAVAATVSAVGGLGTSKAAVLAGVRGTLQLAVVSAVIVFVLRSSWLWAAFVLVMLLAAGITAARRITKSWCGLWAVAAIAAGVAPVLALVLGSGLVPFAGIAVIPVAGILIGNTMVATGLAGRRALDELRDRHGEFEAALALGLTTRAAALEVFRPAAAQALTPSLDQTRTVGLVSLPGSFIGVLLGGASPFEAGAAQLLVLIGVLATQAVAVLLIIELVARGRIWRWADASRVGA